MTRYFMRPLQTIIAAGYLLMSIALASQPAAATAALVIGEPPDVAKDGFSYGVGFKFPNAERATEKAFEICRQHKGLASRCKLITTFDAKCVAIAFDPQDGTPGVGWSIAVNSETAQREALAKCEATAGSDRKGKCAVDNTFCDTGAE